jgi:hypothetical protein
MDELSPSLKVCPVCGGDRFVSESVLWPELIAQWELSPNEVAYINLQQGFAAPIAKTI